MWTKLKGRRIVQWALAYLASAWVLLQVLDLLTGVYAIPAIVLRVAPIVLAFGFIATLIVAWYHGERGLQRVTTAEILMLATLFVAAAVSVTIFARRDTAAAAARRAAVEVRSASVAVLPFENFSQEPEQDYFSDGITEEILNALSHIDGLQVAARTSSFAFKDRNVPVDSIAQRLRVAHVLEGSVRKSGERVRITAQLINAKTGYHMWSETFDREAADVFAIQDEIARRVAEVLKVRLATAADNTPSKKVAVAAHHEYLRGLFYWNKRTAPDLQRALQHFTRATQLQPDYAEAYGGLALTYAILPVYQPRDGEALTRSNHRTTGTAEKAKQAAERALRLAPDLPEAHTALGYVVANSEFNWAEGEKHFRQALDANPNYATGLAWYGQSFISRDPERSLAMVRRAIAADPLSKIVQIQAGHMLLALNRPLEAAHEYEMAIALDSTWARGYLNLRSAYLAAGDSTKAIAVVRRMQRYTGPDSSAIILTRGVFDARLRDQAIAIVQRDPNPYWRGHLLAFLRDTAALDAIEQGIAEGHPDINRVATHPAFRWLRNHPRFVAALKRMNLPVPR